MNWDVSAGMATERRGCSGPSLSFGWVSSESWQTPSLEWRQELLAVHAGSPGTVNKTNLQDFPGARWAPSHTSTLCTPPTLHTAFLWTQSFTPGRRNSSNVLFLPQAFMWGLSVALCACITVHRDPKQFLCLLGDLKAALHKLQAPEMWPWLMWESSSGAVHNNSAQGMEHKGAWCGQDAIPQQSLARKWNMPFLRTNTASPAAKKLPLYALPFESKQNWTLMPTITSSSEAAAWGWGWPQATPSVALSWQCHSASTGTSAACPNKLLCRANENAKATSPTEMTQLE